MDFVASNWKWLVSGVAFVIYVAIQQGLYMSLIRACREFKTALDAGGEDQARRTGGFGWIHDVRAMFRKEDGAWVDDSPLPREAVIDSLDNEIWRASRYSALQRWGLAAPLIGVILSALGFMVSPPELTGQVRDIMTKLGPLFVGVFVGALMALVNQGYLHFSALELGRVRAKAVAWFDEVIWKSFRQNAHNVLGSATAQTQSAAKVLETSSRELATSNLAYRDSLLELGRQLSLVRTSAQSTSTSFDTFSAMIADMTDQLGASIRNLGALNNVAAAVENGSVVWNVAAAKMTSASAAIEESTNQFRATCGNFSMNFDDVRRTLKDGIAESTGGLLEVVDRLKEPIGTLEGTLQQMQTNTERHAELSGALTLAVEQSNQFLTERLALNVDDADLQRELATRTQAAIESLTKLAETAGAVNNTGASLNLAAGGLRDATATIGNAQKSLLDTCNGFSAQCAQLQATMNREVSQTTEGLQSAARELATPVAALSENVSRVSSSTENHAELSERLETVAKQAERLMQDRTQAAADEAARAHRMDGIDKRLEETAQIVSDSAKAMRQLQGGLDALVGELRSARENRDTGRGRWFSWLSARRPKTAVTAQNGTDLDDRA